MPTEELLKVEIDYFQGNDLEVLHEIIKIFLEAPHTHVTAATPQQTKDLNWHDFIKATYGSLTNSPIERGAQATYERREALT